MSEIADRCLVSGADGHVTVTPAGRVVLTETPTAQRGEDLDRIAGDVGSDVALRTLAGIGGTAALLEPSDGPLRLTMTGRIGVLIELPNAEMFVSPTGSDGHTVMIPGDATRFAVAIGATAPSDLTPNTAASISHADGQPASQFVIDLVGAQPDPTPVGLDIVDLSIVADIAPAPLPIVAAEPQPPAPRPPSDPSIIPPQPRSSQPPPPNPSDIIPPQPIFGQAASPQPASPQPAPPQPAPPASTPPPAETPAPDVAPAPAAAAAPGPGSGATQAHDASPDDPNWVLGIRCPLDHHNHPEAEYCSQCGRKMGINSTAVFVGGPRPPLGLFLLDDGGAIPIATDLLIGRDATTHEDVRAGDRQAVLLTDASNVVSRHHLAITLDEWNVTVTDLGSANGTSLVSDLTGRAMTLDPHQVVTMQPGDLLQIGPRTLQLQLHHVAS